MPRSLLLLVPLLAACAGESETYYGQGNGMTATFSDVVDTALDGSLSWQGEPWNADAEDYEGAYLYVWDDTVEVLYEIGTPYADLGTLTWGSTDCPVDSIAVSVQGTRPSDDDDAVTIELYNGDDLGGYGEGFVAGPDEYASSGSLSVEINWFLECEGFATETSVGTSMLGLNWDFDSNPVAEF